MQNSDQSSDSDDAYFLQVDGSSKVISSNLKSKNPSSSSDDVLITKIDRSCVCNGYKTKLFEQYRVNRPSDLKSGNSFIFSSDDSSDSSSDDEWFISQIDGSSKRPRSPNNNHKKKHGQKSRDNSVHHHKSNTKNKSKSSEISKSNAAQQSNKTKNKSDAPRKVKYRNLFSDDDSPSASPSAERNPGNASNISKSHRSSFISPSSFVGDINDAEKEEEVVSDFLLGATDAPIYFEAPIDSACTPEIVSEYFESPATFHEEIVTTEEIVQPTLSTER